MSGGSFDYIFGKDAGDLLSSSSHREQLESMSKAIMEGIQSGTYPEQASLTVADIKVIEEKLTKIQRIKDEIDKLMQRNANVMRSVEWHHSFDSGPEMVSIACIEMISVEDQKPKNEVKLTFHKK